MLIARHRVIRNPFRFEVSKGEHKMSAVNRIVAYTVGIAMTMTLAACGNQTANTTSSSPTQQSTNAPSSVPAVADLKIASWGPDSTKAGVVFNTQPNGSAALWVKLNQTLVPGDVAAIEFNGVLLQGAVTNNFVSAVVPAELYAKPGVYKVRVIVRRSEQTTPSNAVEFTVE